MKNIKKYLIAAMIVGFGFFNFGTLLVPVAVAQGTILPDASKVTDCSKRITDFNVAGKMPETPKDTKVEGNPLSDLLGCAITTGRISLPMVPYFLQYFSNYLLGLVSLIALLFVTYGGFRYTAGGLTQEKDAGKKIITHALMGMTLAFLAWSIVNVILSAITG